MAEQVVLYTWMAMGHLLPTIELGKLFVRRGFSVTLAVVDAPKSPKSAGTIARLASTNPPISFHLLSPAPRTSHANPNADTDADPFKGVFGDLRDTNPTLLTFLRSLPAVSALVINVFCSDGLDVAAELGIPAYTFYASSVNDLTVFLQFPIYAATATTSFKDMGNSLVHFPGVRPIPASHMPEPMLERNTGNYNALVHHCDRLSRPKGILANSFYWLEAGAMKSLKDGVCLPGRSTPPVYCVGPLVAQGEGEEEKHECLTWLDTQPKRSVVFLCFGSAGSLSVEQLGEVAAGLERSGQRFLWVVRTPLPKDINLMKRFEPQPEPDLSALLPEGFLERTKEQGMVVRSWAPQAAVLRHEATGAFVTHCGWNSTLEAVAAGVPMVCWPLYAEQWMNKIFMVEDMKVGVEMKGYDEELVTAEEVEAKVRFMLESEEGKELRERMATAKEQAAAALMQGGSSYAAFTEFLGDLKQKESRRML